MPCWKVKHDMNDKTAKTEALLNRIVSALSNSRFRFNSEDELHQGIAQVLAQHQFNAKHEAELTAAERIDFLIDGIGIEIKIDGSRAAVIRQVHRYAQIHEIKALILITSKTRHSDMPETINNKPLRVINLVLRGAF
jgi:hypothetical protein